MSIERKQAVVVTRAWKWLTGFGCGLWMAVLLILSGGRNRLRQGKGIHFGLQLSCLSSFEVSVGARTASRGIRLCPGGRQR